MSLSIYNGTVAVITGGASGIGRALARELAKRGSEVVIADKQIEMGREVAKGITDSGGKACAVELDVADYTSFEHLLTSIVKRTGRLDYLFNNAGIGIGGPVHLHSMDDWRSIVDVNMWGVINGSHSAYKIMMKQGFGHIVNISSISGLQPSPGLVSYGTTKHAVVGFSIGLRAEAAQSGIRVSVVCPGVVRTPILEGGKFGKSLIGLTPQQQLESWEKYKPMNADLFASKVLNEVAGNKAIIIVPAWWKIFWWIYRLSPTSMIAVAGKGYKKISGETGKLSSKRQPE